MTITSTTNKEETIVVGMGEMALSRQPGTILTCLGLGSCIAICAYDPVSKVGGMAHVVLPQSSKEDESYPAKYADTAVPFLLQEMAKQNADKSRLIVKLAGGAQLSLASGLDGAFKTGERNTTMVMAALTKAGVHVVATDVGGTCGRTVRMSLNTGKVMVKSALTGVKEL